MTRSLVFLRQTYILPQSHKDIFIFIIIVFIVFIVFMFIVIIIIGWHIIIIINIMCLMLPHKANC